MKFDQSSYTKDIGNVIAAERARIAAWRARFGRDQDPDAGLNGIAISGGGIRSAAFALGALQALDVDLSPNPGPFPSPDQDWKRGPEPERITGLSKIDYLSTVSGGGYIGTALTVGMDHQGGDFPFSSDPNDKRDSAALGHIRDYSRYLIPNGLTDLVADLAIVLRGLLANLALIAGAVVLFAGLTRFFNPDTRALETIDVLGYAGPPGPWLSEHFGQAAYSKALILLYLLILAGYAVYRGLGLGRRGEFQGWLYRTYYLIISLLFLALLVEIQPVILLWLQQHHDNVMGPNALARMATWGPPIFAGLTALLNSPLGKWLSLAKNEIGKLAAAKRFVLRLMPLLVSLSLIAAIWATYLMLTYWMDPCFAASRPAFMAPLLPATAADVQNAAVRLILIGLAAIGLFGALPSRCAPNANSLHRLYRDRLSDGFVAPFGGGDQRAVAFSGLSPENGPLHLINTAVNLQSSDELNKRGRNADFFVFSPAYSGSHATGYLRTEDAEKLRDFPDVATAMAISGAAVSTNMGKQSVRGLSPALALLNIRLGYWMTNPLSLTEGFANKQSLTQRVFGNLAYFLWELLGKIDEHLPRVYLTDGGHIENLGLYELLRRRCRTIVVIDAECDPTLGFASLIDAERYARIDLGIRLRLPWRDIAARHAASALAPPQLSPHVALGEIEYGGGHEGTLIYIKASLNGDENDYILEYARKNPAFPQESTSDQFFSEEQFEAYRALGFHATHGAFAGKAAYAYQPLVPTKPPSLKGFFR